jgi:hypothetical protein
MQKNERNLLEVLKSEREFLEQGGYSRSPRNSWRPHYVFEDSLSCMNYDSKGSPGPWGPRFKAIDPVRDPTGQQHVDDVVAYIESLQAK